MSRADCWHREGRSRLRTRRGPVDHSPRGLARQRGGPATASGAVCAGSCRIEPYLDQGGAAVRRRGPAPAPGLCLGGPAGARRPQPQYAIDQPGSSACMRCTWASCSLPIVRLAGTVRSAPRGRVAEAIGLHRPGIRPASVIAHVGAVRSHSPGTEKQLPGCSPLPAAEAGH